MNICEHLTATACIFPDSAAIVSDGEVYSYSELNQLTIDSARVLSEAGVKPGDRVALMLSNLPSFPVWYFGALRIGAIAVSISTRSAPEEVVFISEDCGVRLLVTDAEVSRTMAEGLEGCVERIIVASDCGRLCDGRPMDTAEGGNDWFDSDPDAAALILYTSGTTGFPKGATLSHGNVRSNVNAFNHLCNMRPQDRVLLAVPLFHCFGQNALLNSVLNVGGKLIFQRRFDLSEARKLIVEHKITQLYGVPTMFQLLHDSVPTEELKSVSYCFSAAAPMPIQVSQRWQQKYGLPIHEGYGLTETSPFASYNHRLAFRAGSIGTPIDGVEMKIVDTETRASCPVGEPGEIAIRGPNVMIGYWGRDRETAAAIQDGWFYSGDIGRIDERGYFYIVDRVKDMIAVGGLKVFPAEVERVLMDHDAVLQAAVVGVADDVFGERVVAFVVLSDDARQESAVADIQVFARTRLANYKVPGAVVTVDELPRNPSGKVLKTVLREYDLPHADRAPTTATDSQVPTTTRLREPTLRRQLLESHEASRPAAATEFVQRLVQDISGESELPEPDVRLLDAGLDSLMMVEISSQIQVEVGPEIEVAPTLVFDQPCISDLADYLVATILPPSPRIVAAPSEPLRPTVDETLKHDIESMSEEEALKALMQELEEP